ncbi:MAG: hypothetical protein FJ148_25055, partial [Deltaproteobacteria bacterium]|nr:hypothetical protein [Deltaproteobacteria bacterium]
AVARGARAAEEVADALARVIATEPRARLEYAALCDPSSLEPVARVDQPTQIAVAVWVDGVRLIDNVLIDPSETSPVRLARHESHPVASHSASDVPSGGELLLAARD